MLGMAWPNLKSDTTLQKSPPVALLFCSCKFRRSQSGVKFLLVSVQFRVTVLASLPNTLPTVGSPASVYRPMLVLRAVLPVPNRSYTAAIRGDRSFQLYHLYSAMVKFLFGTSGPGPSVTSGKYVLK